MSFVKSRELWIGVALAIAFVFAYVETDPVVAEEQTAGYQWKCYPKKCHRDSPV